MKSKCFSGVYGFLLSIVTADLVGVEHIGPAYGFMVTMESFLGVSIGTPAGGKNSLFDNHCRCLNLYLSIYDFSQSICEELKRIRLKGQS